MDRDLSHHERHAASLATIVAALALLLGVSSSRAEIGGPRDVNMGNMTHGAAAPTMEDEWRLIREVRLDRRAGSTAFGYVLDRPALISLARLLGPAGAEYFLATGRFEPALARAAGPTAWLDQEVRRFLAASAKRDPATAGKTQGAVTK